jgi:hypothetical protein
VYLAILLLIKAMGFVAGLVKPVAAMLPDWLPAVNLMALFFVMFISFLVGMIVQMPFGRAIRVRIERSLFERTRDMLWCSA